MTTAYPELYLNSVMRKIGEFFDCGIAVCGMSPTDFTAIFLAGSACWHLEQGDVLYVVGRSGVELFLGCYEEAFGREPDLCLEPSYQRSPEYWVGWALSYYQWLSSRTFHEILEALTLSDMLALYPTLHEADVTKFASVAERIVQEAHTHTRLRTLRDCSHLTQRQLAEASGVSLRSIQMYEQRQKDINKAQVQTVMRMARVLGCRMEDLLERPL